MNTKSGFATREMTAFVVHSVKKIDLTLKKSNILYIFGANLNLTILAAKAKTAKI